ncbi:MAG TPA: glutamine--fructose-6-phosphate transaminase (isomerizing) [Anaerolineales bacterium]|jgi:glucosamine--fructose-6-phosphate aminotransferase (isomerizing)|nr:glutamine--fructose-6-phosphate transaminase (isomerizing) [Anaerolineales bacterium]
MCGIFGIITREQRTLGPTLIEAGRMLSYRGYDSVGSATINQAGKIDLRKDVGKVDAVAEKYNFQEMQGTRGILQLRWATFGAPSQANSQPHLDSDGDMVGAHNGNVVNNVELREQFIAEGMTVRSMNDGESCVHAVERYVDQGYDMVEAIRRAYEVLQGDYAFVIGKVDEDVLYAIKKGSGLVAGITEDSTVISSDLPSLLPLTRKIMRIEDGEIVILTHDSIELRSVADGSLIERHFEEIIETMEAAQKGSFPHFMLKEIHEQPTVARELLNLLDNSSEVDKIVARMKAADHVYLVGCGTSYHACMLGSVYFSRLAGKATTPVLAPQFIAQYGPAVGPNDVGMFVSQSGETKDVLNAIETAEERGMGVLGLVNVIGSTLMRVSEHHLPLACGYEISVPATKTFTNQVIAFLYLAMRMGGHDTSTLANLPDLMEETIQHTAAQIETLEQKLTGIDDLYCLGYGLTYPIALEGALKLKEITYLHCEGMLSTEFKHGPLSAVEEGYPVLFVAGQEDVDLIISGINETTTRGGMAVVFGADNPRLEANGDVLVTIPRTDPNIEALLSVIPLQLLSYHMSLRLGFDPDFPRNLSKTLTVD